MTESVVLTVTRHFEASPERVFDAWLDPGQVGEFLFATPTGRRVCVDVDARVGGEFRIDEQRGEMIAEHFGTYLEIDRPRRLVFAFGTHREHAPTRVTIEIVARGAGCELMLTHEMSPEWADYADRTRAGWTMILGTLARVVTR